MATHSSLPSQQVGNGRLTLREAIIYALLGALLVAVQVSLAFLPNIEIVSLLIIGYTITMGARVLFPIAVFVLLQGLIYGFGLWFLNYTYVWAVLVFLALLFRRRMQSPLAWAVLSGAYGLFFGALCSIPYFFIGGPASALAYWLSGIPFDVLHCAGNFLMAMLLLKPVLRMLKAGFAMLQ
ncbi:hypothetical protein LJC27_03265 [Christensenellaceae bacterium OttesenSCG-928-M15]|nr:hypothetical protein [Christensenellaceae bacterium OttesenSCG-928-M15]